mmetsp:Transcript_11096/g.22237  ORF Transcript_11096/g.22237 Transcript_11096/m.22237 type:complete len:111 (+) Transcript_11096:1754-2086(+)
MRKGQLSRAVLPFDDQTSLSDQSDVTNRTAHSLEAKALLSKGALTEAELSVLMRQAVSLRGLLRVKIADDADLNQAEAAVKELREFLGGLSAEARRLDSHPFELLQELSK